MHVFSHLLQAFHPAIRLFIRSTKPAERVDSFPVLALQLFEALFAEGSVVILDFRLQLREQLVLVEGV